MKKIFITLFMLLVATSCVVAKELGSTQLNFDNCTYRMEGISAKNFGYINEYRTSNDNKIFTMTYYSNGIFQIAPFMEGFKYQIDIHNNCLLIKYDNVNHIISYISLETNPKRVEYHILKFKAHLKQGVDVASYKESKTFNNDVIKDSIISDYQKIYNRQFYTDMLNFKMPEVIIPKD